MPRPYKALREQGYKHYFTAFTGCARIAYITIIHSKTSLSVIAGEALYLSSTSILRARRASPLQSLAFARLSTTSCAFSLVTSNFQLPTSYAGALTVKYFFHNNGLEGYIGSGFVGVQDGVGGGYGDALPIFWLTVACGKIHYGGL